MVMSISAISPDQRAGEDELVRGHMSLVSYAVNEMASRLPRHVLRSDLISAGFEGLARAARSYDPDRGVAFDRYASIRIKGALLDELRRRDWASRSVRSKARRVGEAVDHLTAELGRRPTKAEVAQATQMDERSVAAIDGDVHRAVVLNFDALQYQGDGEEWMPSDGTGPDTVLLEREESAYLLDAITVLPERLRRVVIGYFFEERPMLDLANELGVTESRISQMRAEALVLLKDGINSQLEPESMTAPDSSRRVARRKTEYFAAIADASDFRARVSDQAPKVIKLMAGASN